MKRYDNFPVFLNDNIISHTSQRGVTRYFRQIVDGVVAKYSGKVVVFSPELRDYGTAKHIRVPPRYFPKIKGIGFNKLLSVALDKYASVATYREHASIVYSPYYGNLQTKAMQVYTVYDMVHELLPLYFPADSSRVRRFIAEKRHCLERATLLIAISESTARDIVACYPHIDRAKIIVIHLGVDNFFFEKTSLSSSSHVKPYFLYVGYRDSYKNFLKLLVAFGQSDLSNQFDLCAISPTGNNFSSAEANCIEQYHLQKSVHLISGASEIQLREKYANAVALVYPSEYEGFGLPILEAMASGTLVIASNTSSLPEVGGDVAFYIDPSSIDTIASQLLHVANLASEERRERIARGIERASTFTWQKCQQKTVEALKNLLKPGGSYSQ